MRQRLREALHGVLGRTVDALERPADHAAIGRNVDDMARSTRPHRRQQRLSHTDDAEGVHLEQQPYPLRVGLLERAGVAEASIVDQHIRRAEARQRRLSRGRHARRVGHVERERQQPPTGAVRQVRERCRVPVRRDNRIAAIKRHARQQRAETGGAAGDQPGVHVCSLGRRRWPAACDHPSAHSPPAHPRLIAGSAAAASPGTRTCPSRTRLTSAAPSASAPIAVNQSACGPKRSIRKP